MRTASQSLDHNVPPRSRFLELPTELRLRIYSFSFSDPDLGRRPKYIQRSEVAILSDEFLRNRPGFWGTEKMTRILRVNKQIHDEAMEVLYKEFSFWLGPLSDFVPTTYRSSRRPVRTPDELLSAKPLSLVRHIEITLFLRLQQFYTYSGVPADPTQLSPPVTIPSVPTMDPFLAMERSALKRVIARMPAIKSVTLWIGVPYIRVPDGAKARMVYHVVEVGRVLKGIDKIVLNFDRRVEGYADDDTDGHRVYEECTEKLSQFSHAPSKALRLNRTIDEITCRLLFNITNDDFQVARDKKEPAYLNWTSDGCMGINVTALLPYCYRHDFGYRNYGDQSRLAAENRKSIDYNFLLDLVYVCEFFPNAYKEMGKRDMNITSSAEQTCQLDKMSTTPPVILFDYDFSPFGQKIRLLFACASRPYLQCAQPPLLPRPTLSALGITYRRIPVLAMGKDVYCDTSIIIDAVLEKLAPGFPRMRAEKAYEAFGRALFSSAMGLIGRVPDEAMLQDRKTIFPQLCRPDLPSLRPSALAEFRATMSIVEHDFLKAGPWIGGFSMSVEDVHVGFAVRWILRTMQVEKVEGFGKEEFPKVHEWVEKLPRSTPQEIGQEEAIKAILDARYVANTPSFDQADPLGIEKGTVVGVESLDAEPGAHPQNGKLVGVGLKEVVLELENGIRLHFPRQGYVVRKVEG
ncbi:uncharacterized protein BDZ99DRAFT_514579 [Mytilinidion resinicola]|uniref:GST N-terminal domain-containing protein n=1 Tax=Mytilinidion resinicola TaxID=574789 RepID=A0A6A6Z6U0_9PEZI|nr:uncharacterized protein BDZ99DRAFT_514579 [Mytilinidion resinicola]KAF2815955.1 hypothetical protein BDZ99DRAFT_514579 [Mytilinidion resinicola]